MSTFLRKECEDFNSRKRSRLHHCAGKLSFRHIRTTANCILLLCCFISTFSLSYLPLSHGFVSPGLVRPELRPISYDGIFARLSPLSRTSSRRPSSLSSKSPSLPDDSIHADHDNNGSKGIPRQPPPEESSASGTRSDNTTTEPAMKSNRLEEDIAKRLSVTRQRAVTQPNKDAPSSSSEDQTLQANGNRSSRNNKRGSGQRSNTHLSDRSFGGRSRNRNDSRQRVKPSLLPPPIKNSTGGGEIIGTSPPRGNLFSGLSSWEDFLGDGEASTRTTGKRGQRKSESSKSSTPSLGEVGVQSRSRRTSNEPSPLGSSEKMPSITDLFPLDLTAAKIESTTGSDAPPPALDGVLPVSDLFYRSAQSMTEEEDDTIDDGSAFEDSGSIVDPRSASARDDEELPFSAEQSDQLTSSQNRIKIRRNQARSASELEGNTPLPRRNTAGTPASKRRKGSGLNARLVRRGMEMLVGGIPINADPPQRSIELMYQPKEGTKWAEVITTNSRDFGPILFEGSVGKLSKMEEALYCEFFVHSTLKWNVCPKDLRSLTKAYFATNPTAIIDKSGDEDGDDEDDSAVDLADAGSLLPARRLNGEFFPSDDSSHASGRMKQLSSRALPEDTDGDMDSNSVLGGELVFSIGVSKEELESCDVPNEKPILERVLARGITSSTDCSGFEVAFSKLHLADLGDGSTMVSADFTLSTANNETMTFAEIEKKCQRVNSSLARALDDGAMQLAMAAAAKDEIAWPPALRNRIVEEFLFDDDDLDGLVGVDEELESVGGNVANSTLSCPSAEPRSLDPVAESDEMTVSSLLRGIDYKTVGFGDDGNAPFGIPGSPSYQKDDIFLGGGNDGVFWNYAESNAFNAPYQGNLGLRLVDAVTERSKQRMPRVIAIGDVHGCIDELQALLRECDYRPGDLVVFLGDLVSKGPDSVSVVQMAREIGAIAVRGNHDFEVVRWHQAIQSGVDPPVVGSEHFHIATCLTKADMKWLYSLPWYISSPDLGALFVHAGFVSGIRLAKQNPRLMMNMRSILPDGTVTSKFFNNWPWARLWDGPQTVLFGHDADRGLQQYEHAIGLDTGCVYGGRLTACILPEKRLVSVSAKREYFKYRRKHYD